MSVLSCQQMSGFITGHFVHYIEETFMSWMQLLGEEKPMHHTLLACPS